LGVLVVLAKRRAQLFFLLVLNLLGRISLLNLSFDCLRHNVLVHVFDMLGLSNLRLDDHVHEPEELSRRCFIVPQVDLSRMNRAVPYYPDNIERLLDSLIQSLYKVAYLIIYVFALLARYDQVPSACD
jgi:hypothetical protein